MCRDFHSPVNRVGSNDFVTDVRQSTAADSRHPDTIRAQNPRDASFWTSVASCEPIHRPDQVTFEATGRSFGPRSLPLKQEVLPHFRGFDDAAFCAEGSF